MAESLKLYLADESESLRIAQAVAAALAERRLPRCVIWLEGELGAGKTTLARGIIHTLGHEGRVPSPTYTLVETYAAGGLDIVHVDLYRLSDPAEVEYLGLEEAGESPAVVLIEWPRRADGHLEEQDIECRLTQSGSGRELVVNAVSADGAALLAALRRISGL